MCSWTVGRLKSTFFTAELSISNQITKESRKIDNFRLGQIFVGFCGLKISPQTYEQMDAFVAEGCAQKSESNLFFATVFGQLVG